MTNPIYGGSDGFYEELPETPTSTGPNITHIATSNSSSEVPSVPPPRKAGPQLLLTFLLGHCAFEKVTRFL